MMSYRDGTAAVVLEDGRIFRGTSFGAPVDAEGEVVFTTSMTGYQEIATDPSFRGQIVTMTYPIIGNYGVNRMDTESGRIQVAGFIVREISETYSNWRAEGSLDDYLRSQNIVGLAGVDTRALTRHLRSAGAAGVAVGSAKNSSTSSPMTSV